MAGAKLIEAGKVTPVIDRRFPLRDVVAMFANAPIRLMSSPLRTVAWLLSGQRFRISAYTKSPYKALRTENEMLS